MINQLLALTRPLFVLDTETTGTNPATDRIVELGFQHWTADGMDKEWRSLVNPGVPIPEFVSKVHGITDAMVNGCKNCQQLGYVQQRENHELRQDTDKMVHEFTPWLTFKQLATNLAKGLADCDFAGKSVRFDLRILAAEFARAGVQWSYLGARIVDADRLEQIGEPRSLSHLYQKHLGRRMEDAHSVLADVRATAEIIEAQMRKYAVLPRDLDQLHALQWPGWLDGDGKFKFVNGVPCVGQWGKWAGRPMREVDAGYWNFIILSDFSSDVKALARNAKLGKFPETK